MQDSPLKQVACFLVVICSVLLGVGRNGADLILNVVNIIFRLASTHYNPSAHHCPHVPIDLRTVLSRFDVLQGKTVMYAACPNEDCHFTHKPTFNPGSPRPTYPSRCTNVPTPGGPECGHALLHDNDTPIKPYLYHDFKDYLANLLARADLENMMDMACEETLRLADEPMSIDSVFQGSFMRTFEGPMPGVLFVDGGGEGRYVFNHNVDFFNVEGVTSRATKSYGVISMACLNLPLEIRYRPENMYIAGIVPGPKEPALALLNHYLRPLVNDLLAAWEVGIKFTRTGNHPNGRIARAALALCTCDLPAARKASGLSAHSSHFFCGTCRCQWLGRRDRTDFDHADWGFIDPLWMREQAIAWRDADTLANQELIFQRSGVRWSEYHRLPYWNPARQMTTDLMHCGLLGNAKNNTQEVLRLEDDKIKEDIPSGPAFELDIPQIPEGQEHNWEDDHESEVGLIKTALQASIADAGSEELETDLLNLRQALTRRKVKPLQYVCKSLNIMAEGVTAQRKAPFVAALVQWVRILTSFYPSTQTHSFLAYYATLVILGVVGSNCH